MPGPVEVVEGVLALGALLHLLSVWRAQGSKGVIKTVFGVVRLVPGVNELIAAVLKGEVKNAVKLLSSDDATTGANSGKRQALVTIPAKGIPADDLLKEMLEFKAREQFVEEGSIFAYVYALPSHSHEKLMIEASKVFGEGSTLGDQQHSAFLEQVYQSFMHGNALNPSIFPSLRKMEVETVSMTAAMLNGDANVVGSLTSGGTESVLMSIKTYRDLARFAF